MRYAVIIPDGAADRPHPALDSKTPLEAAAIPTMHKLAATGRLGLARTVPEGMHPGSDVANLSVLGYAPEDVYTGRAPLEAASLGLTLAPGEAVFRANTVTVRTGIMDDYAAGHISTEESRALIGRFQESHGIEGVTLYPGIQYRHACVFTNIADEIPDRVPPHDILDQPIGKHMPTGKHANRLLAVEDRSHALFTSDPVNKARREAGKRPATQLWLWGGGVMPALRPFAELYGVTGGLISAVDLLKGIAKLAGLDVINVPGATGYYDTNYTGKGEAALECLKSHDLVIVHVEAPDEAGHNAHPGEKVQALEQIDSQILAPLLAEAERSKDLRLLVMPDHPTPLELRTHSADPVPYILWGPGLGESGGDRFTESDAARAGGPVVAATLMGELTQR